MPAERTLDSPEAEDVVALARDFAAKELAPLVAAAEEQSRFPREMFRQLGELGLLSVSYDVEFGGGGQPYEVYLQVLEELAYVWPSVAVGVSVHAMSCYPIATWGSQSQREQLLPAMLSGSLLGAYCLSEADAGSDPSAMRTRVA